MLDFLCATTSSLHTLAIQPLLLSTCLYHILLEYTTTSKSWSPSFDRNESELISSFPLSLHSQQIIAWSLCHNQLRIATVIAHASAACSHYTSGTLIEYCPPLVKSGRLWLVRRGSSWRNLPLTDSSSPQVTHRIK